MQLRNWNLEAAQTQKGSGHNRYQDSGIPWGASFRATFPFTSNVLNPTIQPK